MLEVPLAAILQQYSETTERYTNLFLPSREKVAAKAAEAVAPDRPNEASRASIRREDDAELD